MIQVICQSHADAKLKVCSIIFVEIQVEYGTNFSII